MFFFNLVIFSWRIIALPCYVGFCHKSTRISLRYTCVHSLLNLPPIPSNSSRLSQSTGLSSPHQTANSHWLSIFYMVIYMFQCYPPPLSLSLYSASERHRVVVQDNLTMIFLWLIVYYLLIAPVENLAKKRKVLWMIHLFPPGQCSSHLSQNFLE